MTNRQSRVAGGGKKVKKISVFNRGEVWGTKATTLWNFNDVLVSRSIARRGVKLAFAAGYRAAQRDAQKKPAKKGSKK